VCRRVPDVTVWLVFAIDFQHLDAPVNRANAISSVCASQSAARKHVPTERGDDSAGDKRR
jgi:hypothetical protein